MYWDILEAQYVSDYKIHLKFANGRHGIADLEKFTQKSGVLAKLRDMDYFKNFSLDPELHVLTWENEVDIAPETLYREATGEPLPAWAETRLEEEQKAVA